MVTAQDLDGSTIAAIATPPGPGGIGIIRVSGPLAMPILRRLFRPARSRLASPNPVEFDSHRLYYGLIIDPQRQEAIDEVLAVFMRAPHTYTREDIVEIQCHGSFVALRQILGLILAAGARLAAPGEFTRRAFINGRIDLTRAEAVLELIEARTATGLAMAVAQLQGRLQTRVAAIRQALIAMRAILEVAIDFPDEDAELLDQKRLTAQLRDEVRKPLAELIAAAEQGSIYRQGIAAVILGRPNVGKSSLLNCLLNEERALVTPIPGTTRDTIEEMINVRGMPVRLIDTAGIRDSREPVEELGIHRALAKAAEADLVLMLLDGSVPLAGEDRQLHESIGKDCGRARVLLVLNKADLGLRQSGREVAAVLGGGPVVEISAKTGSGIEALTETIFTMITGSSRPWEPDACGAPNLRHQSALVRAMTACDQAAVGLSRGLPPDLLAIDLQAALDHLGEIVGETTTEDILDMIFERFCIGK